LLREKASRGSIRSFNAEESTVADKKKPTVKELPNKTVTTKDADKVKGGLRIKNF